MTASAGRSRGLFISYRRQDAAFPAGWLYEQLAGHFGHPRVFKDVDSIQPGEDFLEVITEMVTSSDAVLVVIGPSWLVNMDRRSGRRIDATDDVVRIEIEIALRHGITIIPVLVLGAAMPKPSDLPPSIAALGRRNAIEITPNHFARDVRRLIGRLEQIRQAAPGPAPAAGGPSVGDGAPQPASDLVMKAYRLQVADIAPEVLRGRDAELGQLASYCRGTESYAWWQGEAWAGKTALLAWFALNPPTGVQVVSFFVDAGLAGQSDSEAFLEALAEQLTVLAHRSLGAPATTTARRGRLLELLSAATVQCAKDGRRLLLVVDGLDEDTGAGTGKPSIASLFPRRPPPGLHVLVTSRTRRELPVDVPADHPLRRCTPHRMAASAEALDHERFAQRELAGQLGSSVLCEELLGLIAASGGGLTRDDLAELTCESPHAIETLLGGRFGRSVRSRTRRLAGAAATSGRGYLFAHDTLRRAAEEELGARLSVYRNRLHDWADCYRTRGWHTHTPRYLLHDYPRMLALVGDVDRLSTLACDRARHERMRDLTGGDALAMDEIVLAQTAGLGRHPPDLRTATALALRREELGRRNAVVPVSLPAVWAALGDRCRHDRRRELHRRACAAL